jgi:magnesium-transporting ATPase (P-type)
MTIAPPDSQWHTLSAEEVQQQLETGPDGLASAEAAARLQKYGPNEIEAEREDPWWLLALRQFTDPLVYVLLIGAAVTLALRDYADAAVIFAVVLINAVIGFVQELRARHAMRALAELSEPRSEVIRDGEPREIASRDLVPGDMVSLASGTRVPADARLMEVHGLEIDESMLTGESAAVAKTSDPVEGERLVPGDQLSMVFSGTVVARGRAHALVVRTGADTELGRIATTMREVKDTFTPLQRKMARFGKQIGAAVVALALLVLGIGLLRGMDTAEIVIAAIAVAVSAIPEGLIVVLTVTLSVGVRRMARRHAIVRLLPAVETLGSTTVIGSDKTGTLTANAMTVRTIWTPTREYAVAGTGYDPDGAVEADGEAVRADNDETLASALRAAVLANEADPRAIEGDERTGDPTELALYVAAAKAGMDPAGTKEQYEELDVLPFESERKFMATLNAGPDGRAVYLKGAPEAVIERCDKMLADGGETSIDADAAKAAAADLAARGLRVLALAYSADASGNKLDESRMETGFVLAGLVGMEDPVRPEAADAVARTRAAGIRVLMLTGDHVDTARAIGAQLQLGGEDGAVLSGDELHDLSDDELDERLREVDIYARVAPEHKLRIVERLKHLDEVVAVTGDGVNDAPALRAAHLGIAMGESGTDVAREAADMVLADDNFATITAAIEEGRIVFANVRKVTYFLLSTGVGEVLAVLLALAVGWPLPFVAAQILWINLVTNGLQDIALAFEPGEPELIRRPPRPPREPVLTRRLLIRLGYVGIVLTAGALAMFWWTYRQTDNLELARTVAMTQMVVFQFFHVFNCRSLDRSLFTLPPLSNRFLFVSLVAATAAHLTVLHAPPLQRVFHTIPLDGVQWLMVVAVGLTIILAAEIDKWINRRTGQPLG